LKAERDVGRKRKLDVNGKAEPEDSAKAQAGDESEGRPEDRQVATVAGRLEGGAGKSVGDES